MELSTCTVLPMLEVAFFGRFQILDVWTLDVGFLDFGGMLTQPVLFQEKESMYCLYYSTKS